MYKQCQVWSWAIYISSLVVLSISTVRHHFQPQFIGEQPEGTNITWTMVRPCKMVSSDSKLPGLSWQTTSLRNRFAHASNSGPSENLKCALPCIVQDAHWESLLWHLSLDPNQGMPKVPSFCCKPPLFLYLPLHLHQVQALVTDPSL